MVNAFDGQKGVAAALPHLQVGARLTSFQHTWTDSFTNQFVKEIVQVGHTLPFLATPAAILRHYKQAITVLFSWSRRRQASSDHL